MLKLLRKNTHKIVWAVVISFVLWGGVSLSTQLKNQGRYAGNVFGKNISFQEFGRFYRAVQIFSYASKPPESVDEIRNLAWQSLIFAKEAKNMKLQVSDEEVRDEILRLLASKNQGAVDTEAYKKWVQTSFKESVKEFETQIREILLVRKLVEALTEKEQTAPATDDDIRKIHKLEMGQLALEYRTFPSEQAAKDFLARVQNADIWKSEPEEGLEKTGLTPLKTLLQNPLFQEDTVLMLYEKDAGFISTPLPAGPGFTVFYIAEKKAADEKELTEEVKNNYRTFLHEQRKRIVFINKSFDILTRASLKDYNPQSASPNQS